jgi:benzodiazapine receptor
MNAHQPRFQFIPFVICLFIPLAIGAIGGLFTSEAVMTWYPTLNKPSFNPPNWIFGPMWTLLYILMGIASYRVWQRREQVAHVPRTVAIYGMQLTLNLMWSFLFFYNQSIGGALFEIIVLLIFIIMNARMFYKIDKTAGLLYIPYILWVSFATALNAAIFMLN